MFPDQFRAGSAAVAELPLAAAAGFAWAGGARAFPSASSRSMDGTNGKLLSGPSIWDRSPMIRIDMVAGVMYSARTRSTSSLRNGFNSFLIMDELVVWQVIRDKDADLAGDPKCRLKSARETLDDPLFGEGQLGVCDRTTAGDVGQLFHDLDQRLFCDGSLHRGADLERAGALRNEKSDCRP